MDSGISHNLLYLKISYRPLTKNGRQNIMIRP